MPTPIVALFSAGDLGSSVGQLLQGRAIRVVTSSAGRSANTQRRAHEAGFEIVSSLDQALELADLVISLVPPAQALELAQQCAESAVIKKKKILYVDLNSISPALMKEIENILSHAGYAVVEGAITGNAARLKEMGSISVGGAAREQVVELFHGLVRVRAIEGGVGCAKLLKMLQGGMSKSLSLLYAELAVVAQAQGVVAEFEDLVELLYPGLLSGIGRMLPTYAEHRARRVDEVAECMVTIKELGFESDLIKGSLRAHQRLAAAPFAGLSKSSSREEVVRQLEREQFGKSKEPASKKESKER